MVITVGENGKSSLTEVYVQDFGDNYHRTSDQPSSELEKEARKIRRRYKRIIDFVNARATYHEYMNHLYNMHGGKELFKIKRKSEAITDFIPPKPQMKNTTLNRALLKKKIVVSSINVNKINSEALQETIDNVMENRKIPDALVGESEARDPEVDKILSTETFKPSIKEINSITNIGYLEEYFRNKNIRTSTQKKEEQKRYTLTQIMSGEVDTRVHDTEDDDDILLYRGNYLSRAAVRELELYNKLGDLGWNSVKIMRKKGVSKKMTKVVKNQNKKNKNKSKKKNKKRQHSDDFIVQVMTDNDHDSFADFEKEMLNFTSENIFK